MLAYTGLRWGELVALRVHSVDLGRRRILVQANAPFIAGTIVPGTPKSHEKRSVPFPAFLDQMLVEAIDSRPPDALVFPGPSGDYRRPPASPRGWYIEAKKRTCQVDATFPAILSLHDLRHTAASLAISAGASVLAVQRMLGHASAAMTLDTYSDLFEGDLDKVAEQLDLARKTALPR
ncbi:tyrosine-type recombinase/integrase [Rathayibacter sp. CAU 1779]